MKVRANKGAFRLPAFGGVGVDGQSTLPEAGRRNLRFAAKAELYLLELSAALREGTYQPQAVKRVDIPKGDGKLRPSSPQATQPASPARARAAQVGIPAVKDRIIQQAVRLVIEPIFEHGFVDGSAVYPGQVGSPTRAGGFRPGRGCHDALRVVDRLIKAGYTVASKTRKSASGGGCRLGRLFRFDSA